MITKSDFSTSYTQFMTQCEKFSATYFKGGLLFNH